MPEQLDSSDSFAVSVQLHDDMVVAGAAGDLDYHHAGVFEERVTQARDALAPAAVILDLGAVTFCDSMGIGVLVLLLKQSRARGVALVLVAPPVQLERVLVLTGLRSAFHIEPTVDAAVHAVRDETAGPDDGS